MTDKAGNAPAPEAAQPQARKPGEREGVASQAGRPRQPDVTGTAETGAGTREVGGPPGPEPTRYGDWEKAGRCIDF